jgi:hypothetical protein
MASQVLPVFLESFYSFLRYDLSVIAVSLRLFWGTIACLFHIIMAVELSSGFKIVHKNSGLTISAS